MLQITVYHETDTGVERLIGGLSHIPIRVQRQMPLEDQKEHSPEEPKQVDRQQCHQEFLPVH